MNNLEIARARRAANSAEESAYVSNLESVARKAEEAARLARAAADSAKRYTTYELQQQAAGVDTNRGPQRAAEALLRFPLINTVPLRQRAVAIAYTGMNLGIWSIYSQAVEGAARDLSRMIEAGTIDEQHYTERTAQQAREAERQASEVRYMQAVNAAKVAIG